MLRWEVDTVRGHTPLLISPSLHCTILVYYCILISLYVYAEKLILCEDTPPCSLLPVTLGILHHLSPKQQLLLPQLWEYALHKYFSSLLPLTCPSLPSSFLLSSHSLPPPIVIYSLIKLFHGSIYTNLWNIHNLQFLETTSKKKTTTEYPSRDPIFYCCWVPVPVPVPVPILVYAEWGLRMIAVICSTFINNLIGRYFTMVVGPRNLPLG